MFHVNWNAVATDTLLDELRRVANADSSIDRIVLRPLVAAILHHCGGLPVATQNWSPEHRTAVGRRLLHEAVGYMLRTVHHRRRSLPGCDVISVPEGESGTATVKLQKQIVEKSRLNINRATVPALEALPVLGQTLARRTLDERRMEGPFSTSLELAQRIKGIGEGDARRLNRLLHFGSLQEGDTTQPMGVYAHTFAQDLTLFLSLQNNEDPSKHLLAGLEEMVAVVAANPHPATRFGFMREDLSPRNITEDKLALASVAKVAVLEDESYYFRLQELLRSAKQRIDVAMFFMSFTSENHPTRKLLDNLVTAYQNGVSVRVLLDRDRDDDPYGSRVINEAAIAFLTDSGVPVRTDTEDTLLHSKFVAIDNQISVIGSHNWTAGSYFRYHDISLVLESMEMTQALHRRFATLWAESERTQ